MSYLWSIAEEPICSAVCLLLLQPTLTTPHWELWLFLFASYAKEQFMSRLGEIQ